MTRLHLIPDFHQESISGVQYESLETGQFFKVDPNSAITYRKDKFNFFAEKGRKGGAYNTRTGKHEYISGIVYPCDSMSDEDIELQQSDHQMWGEIWNNHP
ncbi:hypothetical protein [Floridanema evergladense]|uniref:Uncharacterized protein n=1 Tax=Floridaenema evergladense BLCC-F167 TaxID=3153639 RepID=A0ABV4WDS2_9CYAN